MDFTIARKNMVDGQLTPNKITNEKLLERFLDVPREAFVEVGYKNVAYMDSPMALEEERFMFPPLVCAQMLQALNVQESDNVLVVAAGTGYSASILSEMAANVYGVEDDLSLLEIGRRALLDATCKSVSLVDENPANGLKSKGKFNKIVIDVPVEFIPDTLIEQLTQGGQLACVMRDSADLYKLKLFTKKKDELVGTTLNEVVAMPVHPAFRIKKEFEL